MQKRVWFIVILAFLAIVAVLILNHEPKYSRDGFSPTEQANYDKNVIQNSPQESGNVQNNNEDCQVQFSEYLIDPKYVQKVGQVGVVHGGGKSIVERSYISIENSYRGQEIPIYAPTDMKLIGGAKYKISPNPDYMADYVLKFDAGCGVEVLLGHLKGVVDEIEDSLKPLKTSSAEDEIRPPIQFKAGDLIGSYTQQNIDGGVGGFDFVVRDRKVINQFINQERYEDRRADNLISGVCPYDYFVEEKKEAYYNLLGSAGGQIFEVKDCGKASRDQAGTISGMWFLSKEITGAIYEDYNEGDYGSPLSIMGDEEAVSIGNIGTTNALYRIYSNNPTYKLPTQVTSEHCYQIKFGSTDQGYVYFKIIDESTADVYYSPSGSCPSSMPEGEKRYYK